MSTDRYTIPAYADLPQEDRDFYANLADALCALIAVPAPTSQREKDQAIVALYRCGKEAMAYSAGRECGRASHGVARLIQAFRSRDGGIPKVTWMYDLGKEYRKEAQGTGVPTNLYIEQIVTSRLEEE